MAGWVGLLDQLKLKLSQLSTKLKLKLKLNHEDFELFSEPPKMLKWQNG